MDDYLEWIGKRWRSLAIIAGITVIALLAALYHFAWSRDPVEETVRGLFAAVSDNRLDDAFAYVDADSELARYWNGNEDGIQERTREALEDYAVEFDLELEVVTSGDEAEARLEDGTLKVSSRDPDVRGAFPISLKSLDLVFYLERKGGEWLITGINYEDLGRLADELQY